MAFPDNFIGPHQFLSLRGSWQPPREEVQLQARPGVDGLIAWLRGRRGVPFTLLSQVDQPTLPVAYDTFATYLELVGQGAQQLLVSDRDLTELGFGVLVLDVRLVQAKWLGSATLGLFPPSGAFLECEWDLVAVDV